MMNQSDPVHISRYPGIQPFSQTYQSVFYGRSKDIEDLYRFLNVNNLVILYGKSGLGKSSLLNAGLIPVLKKRQNYKTVFIRFGSYQQNHTLRLKDTFIEKIKLAFPKETSLFLENLGINPDRATIWQYLKTLSWENRDKDGVLLVLDQFEEVFTYPDREVEAFGRAISEVVNNRMPSQFRNRLYKRIEEDPNFLDEYSEQIDFIEEPLPLKLLMGIRSDRLSLMDRFSGYLPNILRNTYELAPLDMDQARRAILAPAIKADDHEIVFLSPAFKYEESLTTEILNYLSKDGTRSVETFLLQIICQRIEEWVMDNFSKHDTGIEVKTADIGNLDTIVQKYYANVIEGNDRNTGKPRFSEHEQLLVRYLIEGNLIDSTHHNRISLDKSLVSQSGFPEQMLDKLIDARIIRQEPNTVSGMSYELSHDTLIDPVLHAGIWMGNLGDRIEAYYREHVGRERQNFIETNFLNSEGQSERRHWEHLEGDPDQLRLLKNKKILRQVPEESEEPSEYELYQMFVSPALKFRAERGEKVLASERKKRRTATIWAVGAALLAILAVGSTVVAYQQSVKADKNAELAMQNEAEAQRQTQIAQESEAEALIQKALADSARMEAEEQSRIADVERQKAIKNAIEAEKQRDLALRAQREAEKNRVLAEEKTELARMEKEKADKAAKEAIMAEAEATKQADLANTRLREIEEQNQKITAQQDYIEAQPFLTRARDLLFDDPTKALRVAEHAYHLRDIDSTEIFLYEILGDSSYRFYQTQFLGHKNMIIGSDFSPDGQNVVSGSHDQTIKLWNLKGEVVRTFQEKETGVVYSVTFSPDGKKIISGSADGKARIWNLDGRLQKTLGNHRGNVGATNYSPDGEKIFVGSNDSTFEIWNNFGELLFQKKGTPGRIWSGDFSPDGESIVVGYSEGTIQVVDLANDKVTLDLSGHDATVNMVEFSKDGNYILTSSDDGLAILWDRSGEIVTTFKNTYEGIDAGEDFGPSVWAGKFSPTDDLVLLGYSDSKVSLYELNGDKRADFISHVGGIPSIKFSPNGKKFISFSHDESGRLWNTYISPGRRKIIQAYNDGVPFREIKDEVDAYLKSGRLADLTEEDKVQFGLSGKKSENIFRK